MLLYGHHLYGVVAVGGDSGKYLVAEFDIGSHLLLLLGHADMAFVDEQRASVGVELLDFPLIGGRLPHLRGENLGLVILHHPVGVGRDAVTLATRPVYPHLVELAVFQGLGRQFKLPDPVANERQLVAGAFLPV